MQKKHWEILHKKTGINPSAEDIVGILLKNRNIKKTEINEFFEPTHPNDVEIGKVGISKIQMNKALKRIGKAKKTQEMVIVFGDYDADGVTATAVLWEALYHSGVNAMPYIPNRFDEGYGMKSESITALKKKYPKLGLIITVDNGIVANKPIDKANKLGIDVIITDHHQPSSKKPSAYAIIHSTKISGSAVAWFVSREWLRSLKANDPDIELVALGTVADQMPLKGVNRSFVKYGLESLKKTKRKGLLALYEQAHLSPEKIDTYEVNFVIAPRINAAGRITHALEALRMLCTNDWTKGVQYSQVLSKANSDRQKIVENILSSKNINLIDQSDKIIILASEHYHEGVVGIAASKLLDIYYRPVIVGSINDGIVKASARSIEGFDIIKAIRKFDNYLLEVGGHPMAAGFSLDITNLEEFSQKLKRYANENISNKIMQKKLLIDTELSFNLLNYELHSNLVKFNPIGNMNMQPVFVSNAVRLIEVRTVGQDKKHLKLKLVRDGIEFEAIAFGLANRLEALQKAEQFSIAYELDENVWNGNKVLQLKIKDIKI